MGRFSGAGEKSTRLREKKNLRWTWEKSVSGEYNPEKASTSPKYCDTGADMGKGKKKNGRRTASSLMNMCGAE